MADNKKEKNESKKKGGAGKVILLLIIIIAVILLLLYFGNGFGLGFGNGDGGVLPVNGNISSVEETKSEVITSAEENEENNVSEIIIEISEEVISVNGKTMETPDALREYLLGTGSEDKVYILRDNHSVKSVYDSVKSVMDGLGWEYSEKTA